METTLVLLKPGCVHRQLIGEVINRFERRGLRISGMKMMQLSDEILREHYAHLTDKPFFPSLQASMQASPVVAMALTGVEAVKVVRQMAGVTNSLTHALAMSSHLQPMLRGVVDTADLAWFALLAVLALALASRRVAADKERG